MAGGFDAVTLLYTRVTSALRWQIAAYRSAIFRREVTQSGDANPEDGPSCRTAGARVTPERTCNHQPSPNPSEFLGYLTALNSLPEAP